MADCKICGKKIGFLSTPIPLRDGKSCVSCANKTELKAGWNDHDFLEYFPSSDECKKLLSGEISNGEEVLFLRKKQLEDKYGGAKAAAAPAAPSATDELLKLKQLLDAGVLTQEEFNAKKKQILG